MSQYRGRRRKPTPVIRPGVLVLAGILLSLIATMGVVFTLTGRGDQPSAASTGQVADDVQTGLAPGSAAQTTTASDPSTTTAAPTLPTATTGPATTAPATSPTMATATEAATATKQPASPTTGAQPKSPPQKNGSGEAAWIKISSAGINRPVVPQGLAANGTISPNNRFQVIWYTGHGRVMPGKIGTSVIAAHVTWEGAPDAFYDLESVNVGDTVEVGFTNGQTRTFRVTEAHTVDKVSLSKSATVWGGNSNSRRLAIVTCDPTRGTRSDGHSLDNFLVVAEG